ncbi:MAG: hypothetical protein BRD55_04475 [Bacteroidetes bacterium SW_9_63_38]|nr:MAG: hypothetical protein BRD55_04475 [Bacteroidetes bacterium SW_9_63_38]
MGLVLTGCDSGGSNGGDGNPITKTFPAPSDGAGYADEVAIHLQGGDLGSRLEDDSPGGSPMKSIYDGSAGRDTDIRFVSERNLTSPSAVDYSQISPVDISSRISTIDLPKSDSLERGVDAPDVSGVKNMDDLISFYLNNPKHTSKNGVDFSQFSEKGVAAAISYAEGADILTDFEDGTLGADDEAEWNEAFGHFGAPRDFGAFLNDDGSIADNAPADDVDGDGETDLETEAVYIWADYTADRGGETGEDGVFSFDAFEAFVDGRNAIDNGNSPSSKAATALQAWEATVAANVIHYTNSMKSDLSDLNDGDEITQSELGSGADNRTGPDASSGFEDHWGEAKIFAWTLEYYSDELGDSDLNDIHTDLGSKPPYDDNVTKKDYVDRLDSIQTTIKDAYGFAQTNVDNW